MSQKCPSWAIILLSYSKVIYDHGKAKIWGSKEGPSACIMASHTVSVWVYPLSHWIIHLLIQSFNNISTLTMPPALYTLWGKYKKWSLRQGQRERQTDVGIHKHNRYNSKSEWHWEAEKGVISPQTQELRLEMFKPTQNPYTKKP